METPNRDIAVRVKLIDEFGRAQIVEGAVAGSPANAISRAKEYAKKKFPRCQILEVCT